MSNHINLTPRDKSLLRLLSWSPATTSLLLRASVAFDGEPFGNERRLRERLQNLIQGSLIRSWSTAHAGGGLQNYYKLTLRGFQVLYGDEATLPSRAFFGEVSPTFFAHTFQIAEVIVEVLRACHRRRVNIERLYRENELTMTVGDDRVLPDCFMRLTADGRPFNLAFEIDASTESIDSNAVNSIKRKLALYDRYQEQVLTEWLHGGKAWERPRFRVVFLTQSIERAYHILTFAAEASQRKSRRLVYAATHASFVTDDESLHAPIFLDHFGDWQSLIDLHPTAAYRKTRVRLAKPMESIFGV